MNLKNLLLFSLLFYSSLSFAASSSSSSSSSSSTEDLIPSLVEWSLSAYAAPQTRQVPLVVELFDKDFRSLEKISAQTGLLIFDRNIKTSSKSKYVLFYISGNRPGIETATDANIAHLKKIANENNACLFEKRDLAGKKLGVWRTLNKTSKREENTVVIGENYDTPLCTLHHIYHEEPQ